MIAFNVLPCELREKKIIKKYKLNSEIASCLALIYPVEGNKWRMYEKAKRRES